jgi:hypothetical protein
MANSTSYEAPRYAIFLQPLVTSPSSIQIFSSAPCFKLSLVYISPFLPIQNHR